jgi:hypothetical protein
VKKEEEWKETMEDEKILGKRHLFSAQREKENQKYESHVGKHERRMRGEIERKLLKTEK